MRSLSKVKVIKMKTTGTLFCAFLVFLSTTQISCKPGGYTITGKVVTSDDMVDSGITGTITSDNRFLPVKGAKVFLSLDEKGTKVIKPTITLSDEAGLYKIPTGNLPAAEDSAGDYFIVVEKDGYKPFTYQISIGPLGPYMENTIFLRKKS